jgi:Flp pilus assembly pilin Flp
MDYGSGGQWRETAMVQLWGSVQNRLEREDGATMVEYAIMLVLIAAVSMLIITTIGTDIRGIFDSVDF